MPDNDDITSLIQDLILLGLMSDDPDHKQWCLAQLLQRIDADDYERALDSFGFFEGIKPKLPVRH